MMIELQGVDDLYNDDDVSISVFLRPEIRSSARPGKSHQSNLLHSP